MSESVKKSPSNGFEKPLTTEEQQAKVYLANMLT